MTVALVEDWAVMVLYITTVGVLPGVAAGVIVPGGEVLVVG